MAIWHLYFSCNKLLTLPVRRLSVFFQCASDGTVLYFTGHIKPWSNRACERGATSRLSILIVISATTATAFSHYWYGRQPVSDGSPHIWQSFSIWSAISQRLIRDLVETVLSSIVKK